MPMLKRPDAEIHYEVHGTGPTILLSHGYSSTCRMWDGQVAALEDRYQVVVWDFRGHGESDYQKDGAQYSEALTVGDMAALLDLVEGRPLAPFEPARIGTMFVRYAQEVIVPISAFEDVVTGGGRAPREKNVA